MSKTTTNNPICLIDTTDMDNEKWLAVREHGLGKTEDDPDYIPFTITGSGASCALGVNPWTSDEEYRDRKMGIKPVLDAAFNEESKAAGHIFEPFVAINFLRYMHKEFPDAKIRLIKDCFRDILPYLKDVCPDTAEYEAYKADHVKAVNRFFKKWKINPSAMYQCGVTGEDGTLKYPFALANIDGLVEINGKLGIFEAKTTGCHNPGIRNYWESGKIPPYYYWQLVFYMAVMNLDFAYITCCWGFTLNDMAVICLERDMEVERELMDYLADFVDDMANNIPLEESKSDPNIVSNYYFRRFGEAKESDKSVELPPYCKKMVSKALALDEEIRKAEEAVEKLKQDSVKIYNEFHSIMENHAYATIKMDDDLTYGIKLKTPMHRASFDENRFKEEQPDIYSEVSTVKIDLTKLGKKYKSIKAMYTIPATPDPTKQPSFSIYRYGD